VGVRVGVSVGAGVWVPVGSNGVGETAAEVCVRRSYANWATAVATASTCGVADGLQETAKRTRKEVLSKLMLWLGCMWDYIFWM
jgi:hypothetical protein